MLNFLRSPTNPFAQRLTRNGGPFGGNKTFYACLIAGLLVSLIALIGAAFIETLGSGLTWFQIFIFIASLSLLVSLPIFVTYVATAVAVTYSKSTEFPYLLLTNLTEKTIIQGYLFATFYRCRAILALVLTLCIALSITMKSGGMASTLYPDTLGFGLVESMIKHILMGMLIAALVGSICLIGASLGIMFGLWWQHTMIANTTAAIIIFVGVFWWLDQTGYFLDWLGFRGFAYDTLHALLFVTLPSLLAWLALHISHRWARKMS